jgi:hypothetical protein
MSFYLSDTLVVNFSSNNLYTCIKKKNSALQSAIAHKIFHKAELILGYASRAYVLLCIIVAIEQKHEAEYSSGPTYLAFLERGAEISTETVSVQTKLLLFAFALHSLQDLLL